jgi:hypothetical protein
MRGLMLAAALTVLSSSAYAAKPNTYQVTGEVVALTDDTVTVLKGKEKFEMARTPESKVTGELKKGAKVTAEYRLTATTITVKDATATKSPAGAKKAK